MKKIISICLFFIANAVPLFAQFGQNKVQYQDYEWYFIQTTHFDIYFSNNGETIAEFTAQAAEDALRQLEDTFNYKINNRISLIVYNSHNDFQETNTTDGYLSKGIGGFTEPFKNRVVFPFEGDYEKFRHVIHHELVHAVMQDMIYGGTIQNMISRGISLQLPLWFHEGMAEYNSSGWETNSDMFIRDAIINDGLPDINFLGGYYAYRGGQSVFNYIAQTYGNPKVGEILNKTKELNSLPAGLKASIGLTLEELNERWKKHLKKIYWPEIATKQDPDIFARRLTDHRKDGGFYNTSPAISPQGDKIAFISDRDIFFDIYIMDSQTGKEIQEVVSTGRTNDFEELNVLTPGLTWSPDGKKLALSIKSNGKDAIYIIDIENDENKKLQVELEGITTVAWSPDGNSMAFIGSNASQSDVYLINLLNNEVVNLTNDIFTDSDPQWSPDGKKIFFASDRGNFLSVDKIPDNFAMIAHNYQQRDLYYLNVESKKIVRITNWELSDELSPVISSDGKYLLFISDYNGINNIYKKRLYFTEQDSSNDFADLKAIPITNSLNGIYQLSLSNDSKKLVFSSLYKSGYNIFMLTNPFEIILDKEKLEYTSYMSELRKFENISNFEDTTITTNVLAESDTSKGFVIFSGSFVQNEQPKENSNDFSNYVFGAEKSGIDSASVSEKQNLFNPSLDRRGNYLVNKYKISFSPDLIYANAGFSTLYGLLGTTVLSFSDMLGNHRLIGFTSLQIDIKNSDYGLAYYYLPERIDFGVEGFHTARFVYLNNGFGSELHRFRSFGGVVSASYPLNRFHRLDASLSLLNISSENLDNLSVPTERVTYIVPSVNLVKDNTLFGYTAPIEGERYYLSAFGSPSSKLSFYSFVFDYRNYLRFAFDNSFVFRFSGGFSGGANAQRFFIGGTDNWINRSFATIDIPIRSASDFAFLTPALPLRGYDYAEQIGTKYSLLNLELRLPIIRYLLTGGLPLLFSNILGTAFIDMGSAWDNTGKIQLFSKNNEGNTVTKDLLIGTGFGARAYILYFLLRFDVAWQYDVDGFSKPKYYLSIGADF